jgi:hypothetical protein
MKTFILTLHVKFNQLYFSRQRIQAIYAMKTVFLISNRDEIDLTLEETLVFRNDQLNLSHRLFVATLNLAISERR